MSQTSRTPPPPEGCALLVCHECDLLQRAPSGPAGRGLGCARCGARLRRRRETLGLMAELPLAQLCTHVFAFGHAAEAFRAVDQGIPGLMHAVLDYDRSAAGDL